MTPRRQSYTRGHEAEVSASSLSKGEGDTIMTSLGAFVLTGFFDVLDFVLA